jgi:head-tail adaptor
MKVKKLLLLAMASLVLFIGCKEELTLYLSTITHNTYIDASGGETSISVVCNSSWTATVDESSKEWCSISPSQGENDEEIIVTVTKNTNQTIRIAFISFSSTMKGNLTAAASSTVVPVIQGCED